MTPTALLVAVVVVFVACKESKKMSIDADYDPRLAEAKITNLSTATPAQYGQSLVITSVPGNALVAIAAKDLARWKGKSTTDIQPIRIYLGPWQPEPNITVPLNVQNAFYMEPTPWQPPAPRQLDSFIGGQLFARITFGAGGVRHEAYVDWHPRGSLLQVSAQYIQVDAVGTLQVPPGLEASLPRIAAHISPEPGGGDSVQPATYTYMPSDVNPAPGTPRVIFQVPPFARAFRPLLNQRIAIDLVETYEVRLMRDLGGAELAVWRIAPTAAINDYNLADLPVGIAKTIEIQALDNMAAPIRTINVGCLFYLDL